MKIIEVKIGLILEAFDGKPAHYDVNTIGSITNPFDKNKLKIIDAAYTIEGLLDTIISYYFFGEDKKDDESKNNFNSLILSSDWCTYSSKRKLIIEIVNELELLEGKEKDTYFQLLRKVMSYRNAFTHGEMRTNGDEIRLKYFEGKPQLKTIDDELLNKIEKDLNDCFGLTFDLTQNIKVHRAKIK